MIRHHKQVCYHNFLFYNFDNLILSSKNDDFDLNFHFKSMMKKKEKNLKSGSLTLSFQNKKK